MKGRFLQQPTRRQFVATLGSLALAGMLPRGLKASGRKIIVVGAGLSGLQSALLLEQLGHEVVVLEARQRVGGRVLTLDDIPGHPEGGANTIGPNYGRIIEAAQRFGVELVPQGRGEASGLMIDGQVVDRDGWSDSPLNTLPEPLRSITPDRLSAALLRDNPLSTSSSWIQAAGIEADVSAAEYFASKGLDDQALQWLDVNNSYGNRLADTSLDMLYRVGASVGRAIEMRQPTFDAALGNMRIPEAMAAGLATPVLHGEKVLSVHQAGDALVARSESGKEFRGDALICALPATAVRKIRFEPVLNAEQNMAFEQVEYHKVTQAHLIAESPYWQAAGEPASWWTNGSLGRMFTSGKPNDAGSYNITVWINGDACDRFDVMGHDEAGSAILEEFQQQVPTSRGQVSLGGLVRWAVDPLNEGTWAVWRPGQVSSLPKLLAMPHDRIFFAGEHTAVSNSGMEGAMESADRVVLETLRRLA
jgi:monoamine oxidase